VLVRRGPPFELFFPMPSLSITSVLHVMWREGFVLEGVEVESALRRRVGCVWVWVVDCVCV